MTPRTGLRWRLRDATSAAHTRLDACLAPAFESVAGYGAFVRGMHGFLAAARGAVGPDATLDAALSALARDLRDLDAPAGEAAPEAPEGEARALGWRYVVAGSALGARVLLPRAAALGFDARFGAHYLAAQATGDGWRALLARLDAANACEHDAAIGGAHTAFAAAEAAMERAFRTAA